MYTQLHVRKYIMYVISCYCYKQVHTDIQFYVCVVIVFSSTISNLSISEEQYIHTYVIDVYIYAQCNSTFCYH